MGLPPSDFFEKTDKNSRKDYGLMANEHERFMEHRSEWSSQEKTKIIPTAIVQYSVPVIILFVKIGIFILILDRSFIASFYRSSRGTRQIIARKITWRATVTGCIFFFFIWVAVIHKSTYWFARAACWGFRTDLYPLKFKGIL